MKEPTDFYKNYCIKCPYNDIDDNVCLWDEDWFSPTETLDCVYPKMYPEKFSKNT